MPSPLAPPRRIGRAATARRARALVAALALSTASCGPPAEVMDHARRGDAALEAGNYGLALAAYTRARGFAPTNPILQRAMMRARIHLIAAEPSRLAPEMIDDARYEAETLLDLEPSRKAVYLTALAHIAVRAGDADGAKAKLEEAVKADPKSALAHAALGAYHLGRKDGLAMAKSELQAALASKPDHVGALTGLAQILAAEGDLAGAVEKLTAALKVRDDFGTRMSLGGILVQQQKAEGAIEHFQRAAQLDPKSADALGSLGQALLSVNRPEDAERVLRSAIELRADPPTAIALGFALVRQRKAEQALDVFDRVLARDAAVAAARYGAGMAAEALGKNDVALGHYRALMTLTGGDRQALADMQRDAEKHILSLTAEPAASASASGSAPSAPLAPRGPIGPDPLGARR